MNVSSPTRMKTDPRIVIAGSRALDGGLAPRLLLRFLSDLPDDSTVLLRSPRTAKQRFGRNEFEWQTADVCALLGIKVEWRTPEAGGGREATFRRDLEMVDDADLVLCFHTPEQMGDPESGTAALVDKALAADKPVYGFSVDEFGATLNGSNDPDDVWGPMLAVI